MQTGYLSPEIQTLLLLRESLTPLCSSSSFDATDVKIDDTYINAFDYEN